MEGISTVLLISPPNFRRFNEVIVPFLEKAKDHGVKHIVLSTVFAADGDPSGTFYKAEQVVKQSGLDYTIVRPNFIFENFINIDAQSIRDGSIYLPTGDTKTSYISVEDVAEVYRAVLTHPESHKNKAYNITGNEALNHSEMASIFSEVLKHKVVNINPFSEAYKQTLADAFSKHLSETDELSKIVCISSDLGSIALASGLTFGLSYGMSKAALNMGVKRLSRQLGRNNISIVAIDPGWVKTDMGGSNAALSPSQSVSSMLNVIDRLSLAEIGSFVNYQGDHITW